MSLALVAADPTRRPVAVEATPDTAAVEAARAHR